MNTRAEKFLFDRIALAGEEQPFGSPRDIINDILGDGMIQSPKQAWRTLEKWIKKGLYDYGVALDLGWKTRPIVQNKRITPQNIA